ncbi:class I SAM-dependent methyltransferase [Clostridium sp. YIM B02551]|uniref:class I SAM-dependent methyltransferase n=1 Tax=Clostridium sp. YIM B02551 TaxID=2910679 RepID=UPI001EEAE8A1|nr:class I SAM-dependent methyltransferase [Clostridium sp. YIM B02551]
MSEIAKRLNQCRKPTGDLGKFVVDDMNQNHYELTGWGLDRLSIKEEGIILDIGCGGGRTVNRLASLSKNGKVFGIDYSIDCVNWAREFNKELIDEGRVYISNASVEKLPYDDEMFDIITAVETIYFWLDFLANIKEVLRVLKPTGKFLIINEVYSSERFKERNDESLATGKMKIYSPEELKDLLIKAGYNNISIDVIEERNWLRAVAEK